MVSSTASRPCHLQCGTSSRRQRRALQVPTQGKGSPESRYSACSSLAVLQRWISVTTNLVITVLLLFWERFSATNEPRAAYWLPAAGVPLSEWRSQQQRFGPHLSWEFPSHLLASVECSHGKSPRPQGPMFRSKLKRQTRPRPRGYAWRSVRNPRVFRCAVPEDNVSDLVECGFMWECSNRIYSDFATVRKALNVAIQLVERCARNVQGTKRHVDVKAGNRRNVGVFSFGLRQHKPIRPKPERVVCLRFGCLALDAIGVGGSFERHGHAKGDSFFPFAYFPFPFEPPTISVEWARP